MPAFSALLESPSQRTLLNVCEQSRLTNQEKRWLSFAFFSDKQEAGNALALHGTQVSGPSNLRDDCAGRGLELCAHADGTVLAVLRQHLLRHPLLLAGAGGMTPLSSATSVPPQRNGCLRCLHR